MGLGKLQPGCNCCGACDSSNVNDSFGSLNSRWVIPPFQSINTFTIDSGRLKIEGNGAANSEFVLHRCHDLPTADSLIYVECVVSRDASVSFAAATTGMGIHAPFQFGVFGGETLTLVASWVLGAYIVRRYSNSTLVNTGVAPALGDTIRISLAKVSAGVYDVDYLVNGASIHTISSVPIVWTDPLYYGFFHTRNGSISGISYIDDFVYSQS